MYECAVISSFELLISTGCQLLSPRKKYAVCPFEPATNPASVFVVENFGNVTSQFAPASVIRNCLEPAVYECAVISSFVLLLSDTLAQLKFPLPSVLNT